MKILRWGLLLASVIAPAQTVTVVANHFGGRFPVTGTITFTPVLADQTPGNVRLGTGGIESTQPITGGVSGGVISLSNVPDMAAANPANQCYSVAAKTSTGISVLGKGFSCLQTAQNNSWCSGGVCNLDNYVPQTAPVPVTATGPQGPVGPPGPQGPAGALTDSTDTLSVNTLRLPTRTTLFGAGAPCINTGDSITAGYFSSPNDGTGNVYSTFGYAGILDRFMKWTCSNLGASGSQANDATQNDAIFGTTVAQNAIATMLPGANDMRSTYCAGCSGGMSYGPAQFQYMSQVEANAAWLAIPSTGQKATAQTCPTSGPLTCSFTGSWSNVNALGLKQTTTPGDSVTIAFSGTAAYFFTLEQYANTSTYTITLDGTPVQTNGGTTFGTQGFISRTFNDPSRNYSTRVIRLAGLSAGPHQLRMNCLTASSGSPCYMAAVASNQGAAQRVGPYVFMGATLRARPGGYSTFGGSDALVSQFIAMDREIVNNLSSDGLHVQLVDTSVVDPAIASLFYSDDFHPGLGGHSLIAQAFEDAITAAALPNERAQAASLNGSNVCGLNGVFVVGGCMYGMAAKAGEIGSVTGTYTGGLHLGGDGGGIFRTAANTFLFFCGAGGCNTLNFGSASANYPALTFGSNSVALQDGAGNDSIYLAVHAIGATGNITGGSLGSNSYVNAVNGYQLNGVPGFTGTASSGACVLHITTGLITSVTGC